INNLTLLIDLINKNRNFISNELIGVNFYSLIDQLILHNVNIQDSVKIQEYLIENLTLNKHNIIHNIKKIILHNNIGLETSKLEKHNIQFNNDLYSLLFGNTYYDIKANTLREFYIFNDFDYINSKFNSKDSNVFIPLFYTTISTKSEISKLLTVLSVYIPSDNILNT